MTQGLTLILSRRVLALLAASTSAISGAASAQSAAAPAPTQSASSTPTPAVPAAVAQNSQFSDIVVTARRREESLERVPTAVTALGSAALSERMISTSQDLQKSVPGLVVRESLSNQQISFSIRGQTFDPFSSSPPAVLPYINDVPVTPLGADTFFDLDSVQVLKGPQGTLFGRNTTGGAVLFVTAKPTNQFSGSITGRVGNYSDREFEGYVNVPILDDRILLRVAGGMKHRDGFIENLYDGKTLGNQRAANGRITLTLKPTDTIESTTMFQHSTDHGSSAGGVLYGVNACGTPGLTTGPDCTYGPANPAFAAYVAAHPGTYPNGLLAYLALQKQLGFYKVYHDSPSYYRMKSTFLTNNTTWHLNDNLLLKNVAGLYHGSLYESLDVDGSPYPIFNYGPVGASTGKLDRIHQWSEELQLQGTTGDKALQYIVGGFISRSDSYGYNPQNVFYFEPVFPATVVTLDADLRNTSRAVFAQGTYDLGRLTGIEGLSFTGGIRYTWEHVLLKQLPRALFYGEPTLRTAFSSPSWQVGIQYQANQNLLIYLTQRGSWRSGGFNSNGSPDPGKFALKDSGIYFNKETVKDAEFGTKFQGRIAHIPTRLNFAAYYQVTDNVQRNLPVDLGGGSGSATINVPQAKDYGVEIDGEIKPSHWLSTGGTITYNKAYFSKPVAVIVGKPTRFGPFPDSPRFSLSGFAEVHLPVPSSAGEVSLRGDIYHQTHSYFSSLDATIIPGTRLPGYTLTNFRLSWTKIAGTGFSAAAFVNNAFDKQYLTGGLPLGALFGLNIASVGRPRTFGGEIGFKF